MKVPHSQEASYSTKEDERFKLEERSQSVNPHRDAKGRLVLEGIVIDESHELDESRVSTILAAAINSEP